MAVALFTRVDAPVSRRGAFVGKQDFRAAEPTGAPIEIIQRGPFVPRVRHRDRSMWITETLGNVWDIRPARCESRTWAH